MVHFNLTFFTLENDESMRMRKKPNLIPRMERCAAVQITDPESLRGHWLEAYPGFDALHLEIGCGKGRFTAETAAQNPNVFLAAVEKVPDAMVVGMERVTERGLQNVRFLDFDAKDLLTIFAPGEVQRIYINFPDPWKKSRQKKRRLTYPAFLALYAQVLPMGGEIWFKSDNDPLFEWSVAQMRDMGWVLRELTRNLHEHGPVGVMTDYEAKFHAEGVTINRVVAVKAEETKCDFSLGTSTDSEPA